MILLDTCTFLWLVSQQDMLSKRAFELIEKNSENLFISSISAFEIGIKHRKGRILLPQEPEKWIPQALSFHGIHDIPIDCHIAEQATSLPAVHRDPCDRIIIATAQIRCMKILTPDKLIRSFPDTECVW